MRRQLALVSLAVTSLVVIAFTVPLALLYRDQAEERAVVGAERRAQAAAAGLAVAATSELDRAAIERVVEAYPGVGLLSVVLPDGTVVGSPTEITQAVARARQGEAFREGTAEVVVPVVTGDDTLVVHVGLRPEDLRQGVAGAWIVLGALGMGLILLAVGIADRLGRSFVRPVGDLAVTAERLGAGELTARTAAEGPPEVREVGEALNTLATRVEALLAAERESVADLSHRLRTPLAALKLQAEGISDPEASGRLLEQVDRLQRAVDDLIRDARRGDRPTAEVDLAEVVRNRAGFWRVLADEQGRSFELDIPQTAVVVEADASAVAAVVDTLIGNVFTHTPAGCGFAARVVDGGAPALIVEDAGPGFPQGDVVGRGASGAGSTGLGLDIARRLAERSGGGLEVGSSPAGGARVEVRFGAATVAAGPWLSTRRA